MKLHLLLSFVSLLGCAASGCTTGFGCTEVGCPNGADDSVSVAFPGLTTRTSGAMPLSIQACTDGGSCVTAELTEAAGVFSCEIKSGASSGACSIEANGDVKLVGVLDAETGARASVTVVVTVTDSAGAKVLEASKSVTMTSNAPNGDGCEPICHDGTVSFSS